MLISGLDFSLSITYFNVFPERTGLRLYNGFIVCRDNIQISETKQEYFSLHLNMLHEQVCSMHNRAQKRGPCRPLQDKDKFDQLQFISGESNQLAMKRQAAVSIAVCIYFIF